MLTITSKMKEGDSLVNLTLQENGESISKNIDLNSYIDFLSNFNVTVADTGYIPNCLIRESTAQEGTKRIYFHKELTANVSLQHMMRNSDITLKDNNPSGFTYDHNTNTIVLKDFKLKNVGGIIWNNTSEGYTAHRYAVGFFDIPITGIFNDSVKFQYQVFNNHFDNSICWPDDLDITIFLNNKDPFIQSTFINHYFNSIFNRDLQYSIRGSSEHIKSIMDLGFKDFFTSHFTYRSNSEQDILSLLNAALVEHDEHTLYLMKYLIIYFIFKNDLTLFSVFRSVDQSFITTTIGEF